MTSLLSLAAFRGDYWVESRPSELAAQWQRPILLSIAMYLPIVWGIQRFMCNREAFKLKHTNFFWNLILSALSGAGLFLFIYDSPHLFVTPMAERSSHGPGANAVWAMFCLTKGIEFGDTYLLALRKRKVIFLHAYHHVTVALYSWHACLVDVKFAHVCMCVNLAIHFVMYAYYAASCVNSRHPILVAIRPFITSSQTIQMFVGTYFAVAALQHYQAGNPTTMPIWLNTFACLLMYISYAYLFGDFFIKNYAKGMRPIPTLSVVTIMSLALIGSRMATQHALRMRLAGDLFVLVSTSLFLTSKAAKEEKMGTWASRTIWWCDGPLALAEAERRKGTAKSLLAAVVTKTEKMYYLNELQWWGMVTSVMLPALFGAIGYGNWFLGVCVHGCLRWCIEYAVGDMVLTA